MEAKVLTFNACWRAFNRKTCSKPDSRNSNTGDSTTEFYSHTHKTNISLQDLFRFITSDMSAATFRSKDFFSEFQVQLEEISRGGNVWENNNSHGMLEFRRYAKHNWLAIPSNTQLVKRWVKDENECTFNTKDKTLSNAIAILRSTTIFRMRELALNEL